VRLLLDEQLDTPRGIVADALNIFTQRTGIRFEAFHAIRPRLKMSDREIVEFCAEQDFDGLVTFNHQDFGKKKALYRDLMASGVSVIVLRPPDHPAFRVERQAALIFQHMRCLEARLAETPLLGPVLLKLSISQCIPRTLQELEDEIEGKRRLP
jgi:hypothetical protein